MSSIYVEVFELWAQGLTEAESAAVLKILPNTVKSRRNKIRKVVRERLGCVASAKKAEMNPQFNQELSGLVKMGKPNDAVSKIAFFGQLISELI